MLKRRRFKQGQSLKDRLASFARDAMKKASELPPGPAQDDWLHKARLAETASDIDEWVNSSGLQPPK